MAGSATLTMNRSRLASTIPAQTIARTWLGFVRSTGMSAPTGDLGLTLHSPFALDDQSRPVRHGLEDRAAPFPEIAAEVFGVTGIGSASRPLAEREQERPLLAATRLNPKRGSIPSRAQAGP